MWVCSTQPSAERPGKSSPSSFRRRPARLGHVAERDRRPVRRAFAHDPAVDHVERFGRALQQRGGSGDRLGAQFGRGDARCFAGHHRDARGEGAHAVGDAVGLAVHDAHAGVVDAERVGADLRQRGFHALANRSGTGNDFDGAFVVDRDAHAVERPEPAFLDKHRDAGADRFAFGAAAAQAPPAKPASRLRRAPCRAAPHSRRNRRSVRCRGCRNRGHTASRSTQ